MGDRKVAGTERDLVLAGVARLGEEAEVHQKVARRHLHPAFAKSIPAPRFYPINLILAQKIRVDL